MCLSGLQRVLTNEPIDCREIPSMYGKEYEENTYELTSFIISSPYSSIYNYNLDGIHWAYLSNVCMEMTNLQLLLFQEKPSSRFEERLEGYQHMWKFKKVYESFPEENDSNVLFWSRKGAWMIIPGWSQHTSHFTENILMVNHRAADPSQLPPVTAV